MLCRIFRINRPYVNRLQEHVDYEEPHSLDEEDARSSVADLITVNESAADDAYSLAYIQVNLRLLECCRETAEGSFLKLA
jgi:hypothetical protein